MFYSEFKVSIFAYFSLFQFLPLIIVPWSLLCLGMKQKATLNLAKIWETIWLQPKIKGIRHSFGCFIYIPRWPQLMKNKVKSFSPPTLGYFYTSTTEDGSSQHRTNFMCDFWQKTPSDFNCIGSNFWFNIAETLGARKFPESKLRVLVVIFYCPSTKKPLICAFSI